MRGSIRGYVVSSADQTPIQDAAIMAVHGPELADECPSRFATADRDGSFFIAELRAGEWVISVRGPNGGTATAIVCVLNNSLGDVTIEIEATGLPCVDSEARRNESALPNTPSQKQSNIMFGTIRGYVVQNSDGTPVADATITIVSGPGPAPDLAPLTNAEGSFSFGGLPGGQWLLRTIGPSGETVESVAHVVEGAVTETTITLTKSPPSGRSWNDTPPMST